MSTPGICWQWVVVLLPRSCRCFSISNFVVLVSIQFFYGLQGFLFVQLISQCTACLPFAEHAWAISVCATLQENNYRCNLKTFSIDRRWLYDRATKFTRWQHPAVGCGARLAVTCATCLKSSLGLYALHVQLYTLSYFWLVFRTGTQILELLVTIYSMCTSRYPNCVG